MQSTRRVLNTLPTPNWHAYFHKSDTWKSSCACANRSLMVATDSVFCLTQRWGTARSELNQALKRVAKFDITLGDIYRTSVLGVQLFLIFHAGKVVGRGSFQGYSLGPSMYSTFPDKNAAKAHH